MTDRRAKRKNKGRRAKTRSLQFDTLTERQKTMYERSSNLLSDLRRGEGSYSELLRKHRLSSRTARKYLGRDLLGGSGGKPVRASKSDRRVRLLMFPKAVGDVPVRTRNSRDATELSEFFRDRDKLLHDKMSAEDFEVKWRGKRVAGEELFTDVSQILVMADSDDLKVENLYASTSVER